MEALGALRAELQGVERRVDGVHTGLGVVRAKSAAHDTAIEVIHTEVGNIREDIGELKDKMKWIIRGLFGAIAVGLMFVVAIAGLILQASG
jgi:uncharacterized protein YdhG (YjbR/CyaY superfamily)